MGRAAPCALQCGLRIAGRLLGGPWSIGAEGVGCAPVFVLRGAP